MKSLFILSALAAVAMTGCKDETEPDTHVTEYYHIVNRIESDITVELPSGEVVTIESGEEREIQRSNMGYKPGIAYSRPMYTVGGAVMRINGAAVPELVWLFEYWDSVREDGPDSHHYSVTYTLTVTAELLEQVRLDESII